jgi:hypothetical protein
MQKQAFVLLRQHLSLSSLELFTYSGIWTVWLVNQLPKLRKQTLPTPIGTSPIIAATEFSGHNHNLDLQVFLLIISAPLIFALIIKIRNKLLNKLLSTI